MSNDRFNKWYKSYWKKFPDEENPNTYKHQTAIWEHQDSVMFDIEEQLKEKNKWIKELLENQCECENCGCTEMLCGHNGAGCSSER